MRRRSPADPTVLPATNDDGPVTPTPQLVGVWTSGEFRLKLDSNGVFRATLSEGGRIVLKGSGTFQSTAKTVRLSHRQGTDRLEIKGLTGDEFRIRFQGHDLVLRREAVTVTANGVAGTTWNGTETLSGFGKLSFRLEAGGKAVMTDAKSTAKGDWIQTGDHVTITFVNCVYHGTVQGQTLSGTAEYTTDARTWTFALTRAGTAPAAAK